MREHVIGQKVGNRTGMSGKGRSSTNQRPARRERGRSGVIVANRFRGVLAYLPLIVKFAVAVSIGVVLFLGYRAAASASFFQLRKVEVQGAAKASVDSVQAIVRHDVAATGVWKADLKELSAHIERLPWVRSAIVTRVLPDGIRVRISERVPRVVVRLASGRFVWVDEDAVSLGEMQPTDEMPPFFLRGWNEDESETARKENLERIKKYLELRRLWDNGLAERVSEVNLVDTRDVRAQLAGDDSQIEVRLGSQDLGKRLKQALDVLDEQRQTSRGPFISYIDLTQGKRAIVGFVSGAHTITDSSIATQTERAVKPATGKDTTSNSKDKTRNKENKEAAKKGRTR